MNRQQSLLHCISCELSCELYPVNALRSQYCKSANFAIWPEGNQYLNTGISQKWLTKHKNHLYHGFVFVDFSFPYLRTFSDEVWIERLARTDMHIVLIVDRRMAPLANYWILNSNHIQGVIYTSDSEEEQKTKLRRLFTGRQIVNKQGSTLNYNEFILLQKLMKGFSVRQAMQIDNPDIKKMYVHKFRLEQKLGCSIHKIITSVL